MSSLINRQDAKIAKLRCNLRFKALSSLALMIGDLGGKSL